MSEDLKTDSVHSPGGKSKEILELLKGLNVVELNELIKNIESEFQISASQFAPVQGGAKAEEKSEEEEDANKDLYLVSVGGNKIGVIKLVRELTSLGLMEAKKIVDGVPSLVKSDIPSSQFEELKNKFQEIGASVEFKLPA